MKAFAALRSLKFPPWTVPLALLAACLLGFGWMLPLLGLYWDDWPVFLVSRLQGLGGLWEFYTYDRPFSAWTYWVTLPWVGYAPLSWHILTLLLRWLTAVCLWWALRLLWPERPFQAAAASLLFSIYPVFLQQPIAVAYNQHWLCFALLAYSLAAMLQAARSPRWFWPLTLSAVTAQALQLFTMEYFVGLEVLRPFLLWIGVGALPALPSGPVWAWLPRRFSSRLNLSRWLEALRQWLPYLAVGVSFIIWRLFFLTFPNGDPNNPQLIAGLLREPLKTAAHLAEIALQDLVHLFFSAWSRTLTPQLVDLSDRFAVLTWLGVLGGALAAAFYLHRLAASQPAEVDHPSALQPFLVGLAAAILGVLPVWITDRQVIAGLYANRFGLASMFGLGLCLSAALDWFTPRRLPKVLLIGVLIGLALGLHWRTANDYRWAWVKQQRFYWQLAWRAPWISPQTALLSDGELFPYVGIYSTAAGINLLYAQPPGSPVLDYWFFSLGRDYAYDMPGLLKGTLGLNAGLRNLSFQTANANSLVIFYRPEQTGCLWVLDKADADLPDLPALTRQALPLSDLSRISPEQRAAPAPEIFGAEPAHSWCYYFEKAELARQLDDWSGVLSLGETARGLGYTPTASESNTPREWFSFIEAYARANRWQEAQDISLTVLKRNEKIAPALCRLWQGIAGATPPTPARKSAQKALSAAARCP